ncbi:MAG: hypothetical protein INR72_13335 [Williamsia herbipolensis]|nr:hypothetical protein [Williamsia herbipolensis]
MSDLTQSIVMSGGFFALMLVTQFGTRSLSTHRILASVGIVVGVGFSYLEAAPTDAHSLAAYAVAVGVGLVFRRPRDRDHEVVDRRGDGEADDTVRDGVPRGVGHRDAPACGVRLGGVRRRVVPHVGG